MRVTLKGLRSNFNLTQEQAAKKANVSVNSWYKWEKGISSPSVSNAEKIMKAFNVRFEDLIFLDSTTVKQ